MPQLRWTLLILGALFLAGMALWESLRGRRARAAEPDAAAADAAAGDREQRITEPRTEPREPPDDMPLPSFSARDPERERMDAPLPVFELPQPAPAPGRRLDPILDFEDAPLSRDEPEPPLTQPAAADEAGEDMPAATAATAATRATDAVAAVAEAGAAPVPDDDFEISPVRAADPPAPAAWDAPAGGPDDADPAPPPPPPVTAPIVEWPDPEHSQVLSVRVLAPREKFQGRAVRLALTAQGFLPGRFSIYHKPAPDGRALLSVASLTKPGTFEDPPRGDMQRFSGLNLFTVLPGPLPPAEAVEELLQAADTLALRLQGLLTDDQGEPLSEPRAQQLRALVSAQAS